tara:strand:+ start:3903 stop:6413 length:2511 start_codon:yes stop_codon:yes gene_type:complete
VFINLVLKSLWVELRDSLSVILALSVGLIGLSLVLSSRTAVESQMQNKAQEILTSDLSISARRIFNEPQKEEFKNLIGDRPYHSALSLFTMSTFGNNSRLTYVKAIPKGYPFYGNIQTNAGPLNFISNTNEPGIYGDQQFFDQLNVREGDKVQIGKSYFLVKGKITDDSSQSFRFSSLAPKVYIFKDHLIQTGLIQFGSTISETIYVKTRSSEDLDALQKNLLKKIKDTSVRIQTSSQAANSSVRALSYLSDYLGLIALAGFMLASLGAGFIFYESLTKQLKVFSIFQSLGLSRRKSLALLLLQTFVLAAISSLLSFIVSIPLFSLISKYLLSQFQIEVSLGLGVQTLFALFTLAFISSLLISLSHFSALLFAPMRSLLDFELYLQSQRKPLIASFLLSLAFMFGIGILISRSYVISGFFSLGLLLIFGLVGGIGLVFIRFLSKLPLPSWAHLAFLELNGRKATQLILLSVMSISILLLNSVNQIEHSIQNQINVSSHSEIPSYFLFDIQDNQIGPLKDLVNQSGLRLVSPSPMIRAKMIAINGKSYEIETSENRFETREEAEEARFRNRGLNLSYRSELYPGEKLIAGQPLPESYKEGTPIQLSVEKDYARRVKLSLGDSIEMNVQGLKLKGIVHNLRQVSWTTFRPNFFVVVQPGVLEGAPKTWLAGISRGNSEETQQLLRQMDKDFPNVSYVDLDQAISKIREITGQMSQALLLTAALVLLTGLFIMFTTARFHFQRSQQDLNLIRILGADPSFVTKKTFTEQMALSAMCLFLGLLGSYMFSYLLMNQVFDADLDWKWKTPGLLTLGLLLVSIFISDMSRRWSQSTSPKSFLS